MSEKPALLIMQRHLGPLSGLLDDDYTVYRFWEGPPTWAAGAIRVMVVAGEFPLDKRLIESLPNLGLIACFTSGYDRIDLDWCRARGLPVTHAPGVNHEEVADHALGMLLAVRRRIVVGDREVRAGGWSVASKSITRAMRGQKTGIVGLGRIGEDLARRCELIGMEVRWWGPREKPSAPWPRMESLMALAQWSENLVLCLKVDETNEGLVDREILEALGPEGLLVNVARGQVVDEDALIDCLKAGKLGYAALDVFIEEPTPPERWAEVPNTVLTPHTAGATTEGVQRMLGLLVQNLDAFFSGRELVSPVS